MSKQIVVVGAGVIGLSTALVLAEAGYNIVVVASHFHEDGFSSGYTSLWAGAHFRPFPSKSKTEFTESKLARETLNHFKTLERLRPDASVRSCWGYDYVEEPAVGYVGEAKGYSEGIDDYQILDPSSIDNVPRPLKFAARYRTWTLNPSLYLSYMFRALQIRYGATFVKAKLNTLREAFELFPDAAGVVNATGMGLQWNGGYDPDCFPIRGQTLLVRPPLPCPYEDKTITHQSSDGLWTFVIPRPLDGGMIVGGTKQPKDFQESPRDEDTRAITERARVLFPELFTDDGKLDIIKINVGFRPARASGVRIELEKVGQGRFLVHAYGLGGSGYEMSHGVAKRVHQLIKTRVSNGRL
uniref:ARAD1A14696p n=1 Tax=Blastobotrys adeninivorans TaxID=409370 RepID=A0A060SXT9_BLAAD